MQGFQAVLFDLDGTLLDSAPDIIDAFTDTLSRYGKTATPQQLRSFLGPPLRDSFAQLLPPEQIEPAVALYRAHYDAGNGRLTSVYPGVSEMLAALRAAGYLVCLATSKQRSTAEWLLREKGLAGYFNWIGGAAEDNSLDTKTAVMRHVLSRPLLLEKRAIMVGDRENDLRGAADCGIPALGALYGYGSREELAPYAPLAMLPSVQELCDWLLAHRA